ncbi:hypothetical protein [Streptomyces sp. NPDC127084]|uniref:hypothetical protein n=1 Tax=Streptomyces sp. NPDC127084 TaxID=3347133 RepID=UPI00364C9166
MRSAGFVVLLTCVFLVVNTQVVYAASSNSETGDLLAPLNITSSEGVPINGYELNAEGGSIVDFESQALAFGLSGVFTLIRMLVGLAGWAIEFAFRFPLLKILTDPAQKVSDVYNTLVVDALGLKGLLLAWAFVFVGFMLVRGRVGRGLGEMFLTLLLAALAASAFVRPDYLLAEDGPLGQAQQVGAEVAQSTVNAYDWGGKISAWGPCFNMTGLAERACLKREASKPAESAEVARPIQDSLTNALVVKPYMLLQYGRVLDPGKASDREAYAVHLRWVSGDYRSRTGKADGEDPCDRVAGIAQDYCISDGQAAGDGAEDRCRYLSDHAKKYCQTDPAELPQITPGGELLDTLSPLTSEEDREFAAFVADLKKAGKVGEACAEYAKEPTWWRIGGAVLLLIAAVFVCGMLLSSATVLLGTQGVAAAAAAVGGVTFIAAMLPGPPRQSVWKWLSLWGIAVLALVGICAFVPFFAIAMDVILTDGPDLVVERILLIDVLAIVGAAGHRRLLTGITSFGQRMAMRMRYAKVGGTHLPGDTSELGAALAMNSPAAMSGYSGGLRAFALAGGGRFGVLGTRHRLMGALSSLVDGAGMPVDTGRMFADATAEAGRGLAPLTAAAAAGGLGARLGAKGGHWLLIGRRPGDEQLARWRKATTGGDPDAGGPGTGGGADGGGGGPRTPGGPPHRYRDEDGRIVDRDSGQVLHDQNTDRTLLSTRAHNRLVRLRGYRILHRGGRAAYGASVGLPANVRRAGQGGSRYAQDARQQVRVWANTVREDGRAWADAGRHVSRVLRENNDDRSGDGPFTSRRLPTATAATPPLRPRGPGHTPGSDSSTTRSTPAPVRPTEPPAARTGTTSGASPSSPTRITSGLGPASAAPARTSPVLPGGTSARDRARQEARTRMQELMRRTAPEAERLRQERDGGGDG